MRNFFLVLSTLFFTSFFATAQNCPRYIDGDSLKTTPAFSIYREYFKKGLYDEAYTQWKNIFDNAPGFRVQTFIDGTLMYEAFIQKTTDKDLRKKFIDTLFQVYEKQEKCHGDNEYLLGTKSIALLKYGTNADIPKARVALERMFALNSKNPYPYYIQTYFKLLDNQKGKDPAITDDYFKTKYDEMTAIVDKNIADPKNSQLQAYKEVKSLIDDIYTQNFADKTNPNDCAKLMEIYLKKYNENANDLETIKQVYTKTKGCADSALNVELLKKLNHLAPSYTYANRLANVYMQTNNFDSAYVLYENALKAEKDSAKLADMLYIMASIKAQKEDYSTARDLAKQAISYRADMGKAYMLIGNLYLGSGKLCGPGTGFQSQIVLWPAFDYLKKAIEVGSDDVKEEAQKMITEYTKYLPTKADIIAKKLNVGAPYTVKCWINEETTVKIR